jgi:membrane protein DedA with SNARE-associated domain
MDPAKYVSLHWVLFAAWFTGLLALAGQFFVPEPYRSALHLDAGAIGSVPIILIVVFCFILWFPALRSSRNKLHVPDSLKHGPKDWQ